MICEHASNRVPASLDALGLSEAELRSHIAWDPGAAELAGLMSRRLDAPLIKARFSRLVFDCNRSPRADSAILARSDGTVIPGNQRLTAAARAARARSIYHPFRARTAEVLSSRRHRGGTAVLITVHSFTPIYGRERRAFDLGVLHDSDTRLADQILRVAAMDRHLEALRNAPYGPDDGVTHTLVTHAIPNGLLNAMLEVRSDLISEPAGRVAMAERLSGYVSCALEALSQKSSQSSVAGI